LIPKDPSNPLSDGQIIKWAVDIAKGVLHLHKGGQNPIIHRDLAARNILVFSKPVLIYQLSCQMEKLL
jgi:serine/threonine protein kinase